MNPRTLRFWLVLVAVLCPSTAVGQQSDLTGKWMLEGSGGMSLRPAIETWPQELGVTTALFVGRTMTPWVSWRAGIEYESWGLGDPDHNPYSFGFAFAVVAAATAHNRGLYAKGQAGLYMHPWAFHGALGGYLGVGAAAPTGPGALTFEAGLQGYAGLTPPGPDDMSAPVRRNYSPWSVRIGVGYRGPM